MVMKTTGIKPRLGVAAIVLEAGDKSRVGNA